MAISAAFNLYVVANHFDMPVVALRRASSNELPMPDLRHVIVVLGPWLVQPTIFSDIARTGL